MPTSQVQDVTSGLLEAIGLVQLSDADATQQAFILRAINAGIDEIATSAPVSWFGDDEAGDVLLAPTTGVAITVTANSKVFTSTPITTAKATMGGQSIVIDGDAASNRIVRLTGDTRGLLLPFGGSTGDTTATVYYDTLAMPDDFLKFKGAISIIGERGIDLVDSQALLGLPHVGAAARIGTPTRARMLTRLSNTGYRSSFLQFDSLPDSTKRIFYEYRRRPPSIATLSDDRNDLVPSGYVSSVLLPICRKHLAKMTSAIVISPQLIAEAVGDAGRILISACDADGYSGRSKMASAFGPTSNQ